MSAPDHDPVVCTYHRGRMTATLASARLAPPEAKPALNRPLNGVVGRFVTRLMAPPSAFGPMSTEVMPFVTRTSDRSSVTNRSRST